MYAVSGMSVDPVRTSCTRTIMWRRRSAGGSPRAPASTPRASHPMISSPAPRPEPWWCGVWITSEWGGWRSRRWATRPRLAGSLPCMIPRRRKRSTTACWMTWWAWNPGVRCGIRSPEVRWRLCWHPCWICRVPCRACGWSVPGVCLGLAGLLHSHLHQELLHAFLPRRHGLESWPRLRPAFFRLPPAGQFLPVSRPAFLLLSLLLSLAYQICLVFPLHHLDRVHLPSFNGLTQALNQGYRFAVGLVHKHACFSTLQEFLHHVFIQTASFPCRNILGN